MEGAPISAREGGFGRGLTDAGEWAAKFRRAPAGEASAAVGMPATGGAQNPYSFRAETMMPPGGGAATGSGPARFRRTSTGPEALMRSASGPRYVQTTDMKSRFEAAVPGWGGMPPEQRRAALMAQPSPASRGVAVGQETGRSGYVSTSADAAARIAEKYRTPGSAPGVVKDVKREAQREGMEAATPGGRTLYAAPDLTVGAKRKAAGMVGGAATRFRPGASAPASAQGGAAAQAPAGSSGAGWKDRVSGAAGSAMGAVRGVRDAVTGAVGGMVKPAVNDWQERLKAAGSGASNLAVPGNMMARNAAPFAAGLQKFVTSGTAGAMAQAPGRAMQKTGEVLLPAVARASPTGWALGKAGTNLIEDLMRRFRPQSSREPFKTVGNNY